MRHGMTRIARSSVSIDDGDIPSCSISRFSPGRAFERMEFMPSRTSARFSDEESETQSAIVASATTSRSFISWRRGISSFCHIQHQSTAVAHRRFAVLSPHICGFTRVSLSARFPSTRWWSNITTGMPFFLRISTDSTSCVPQSTTMTRSHLRFAITCATSLCSP